MSWLILYSAIAIIIFIIIVYSSITSHQYFHRNTKPVDLKKEVNVPKYIPLSNEFKPPTAEELALFRQEQEQIRLAINLGNFKMAREIAISSQVKSVPDNRYKFNSKNIED